MLTERICSLAYIAVMKRLYIGHKLVHRNDRSPICPPTHRPSVSVCENVLSVLSRLFCVCVCMVEDFFAQGSELVMMACQLEQQFCLLPAPELLQNLAGKMWI